MEVSALSFYAVVEMAKGYALSGPVEISQVRKIVAEMKPWLDQHGRYTPDLQALIWEVERLLEPAMTPAARREFQAAIGQFGAKLNFPIVLPKQTKSLWLAHPSPFHDFQSQPNVPEEVDVLIIGAGLTGASAGYFLSDQAASGQLKVAVVELNGVAEGASGNNGGNFELMQESFINNYEGLVTERFKFLRAYYLAYDEATIVTAAREQARMLMQIGVENARLFKMIVDTEGIQADVSSSGWLRLANSQADVAALRRDMMAAREFGIEMQMLSPEQVFKQTGMKSEFAGRMAYGFGNYHPKKFVDEVFKVLLRKNVELYTQTRVLHIDSTQPGDQPIQVHTNRGTIRAKKVIMATDAYTPKLLPQTKGVILPYKSVVLTFEHIINYLDGITGTERDGDLYYNGPRINHYVDEFGQPRMSLLIGGGPDVPVADAERMRISPTTYKILREWITTRFPWTANQPASRAWTKAFGFTPDRMLIADHLSDPRVIAFIGTQGYGGSMCMLGGMFAARLAAGEPREVASLRARFFPEKHVSSKRFCSDWLTGR